MEKETRRIKIRQCEVTGFAPYVTEEKIQNGIKKLNDKIKNTAISAMIKM